MSTQYHDGHAHPDDPLDQRSCPFDWESLERSMGEAELGPVEYERMALAFGQVLRWILGDTSERPDSLRKIGTRLLVVASRVSPETLAQHRGRQRLLRIVRRVTRST